eukprot:4736706-Alexandrium_andersonii.AAC.1
MEPATSISTLSLVEGRGGGPFLLVRAWAKATSRFWRARPAASRGWMLGICTSAGIVGDGAHSWRR